MAELGSDSVGVIDLKQRELVRTLTGIREPQEIGYSPATNTLYIASAGNGSVHVFHGDALEATSVVALAMTPTMFA